MSPVLFARLYCCFPSVSQAFIPSSQFPKSCCSLRLSFVIFCSLLPVPSPLSVFMFWTLPTTSRSTTTTPLPYVPVLQSRDSRYRPTPASWTFSRIILAIPVAGSLPWTVVPLSRFPINHCFPPELGLAICFCTASLTQTATQIPINGKLTCHTHSP